MTDERHDNAASDHPSGEPADATLKGGESGPPKTHDYQQECKTPRRDALDWLTFAVLCVTFIAVAIYAWYARDQAIAGKDAADAATAAAKAAAENVRAFKAAEGAYLHISLADPPIFDDRSGILTIPIRNDGHLPSRRTQINARVVAWAGDASEQAVETIVPVIGGNVAEIGPGETYRAPLTVGGDCIHLELVMKYDAGFNEFVSPQPRFCISCECPLVGEPTPSPVCFASAAYVSCAPGEKTLPDFP